jgi:hypothetical protein
MWITLHRENADHNIPINDLKDHDDNARCWCKPEIIEYEDDIPLVAHHSRDGREFYEQEERLKGH